MQLKSIFACAAMAIMAPAMPVHAQEITPMGTVESWSVDRLPNICIAGHVAKAGDTVAFILGRNGRRDALAVYSRSLADAAGVESERISVTWNGQEIRQNRPQLLPSEGETRPLFYTTIEFDKDIRPLLGTPIKMAILVDGKAVWTGNFVMGTAAAAAFTACHNAG